MSLLHINYFSQALQKQTAMFVALPDAPGPYPVVYQLHGLSDDYTIWQRRTSIERYADALGIMVVMPDGGRGFYTDGVTGGANYEQHILDTVQFIDRTFRTVASKEGRAIGGLSMGGYGAMKLGLKYPDTFGSIASHSGVLDIASRLTREQAWELKMIFGDAVDANDCCLRLAEKPGPKPAIYFDCGVDDFLIEDNRLFAAHLERLGLPYTYEEFSGAHTWEYWDAHVPAALQFHVEHFG